jgi:hypothetical protein
MVQTTRSSLTQCIGTLHLTGVWQTTIQVSVLLMDRRRSFASFLTPANALTCYFQMSVALGQQP